MLLRLLKLNSYFKFKAIDIALLIMGGILSYFIFFHKLDANSIENWDEARYANSSFEMLQNKNFIVPYYNGSPEIWSVKPPLMNWIQVFFMKIFGPNELAVRLPSAIAALLTMLLIIWFCFRHLNSKQLGYFSALVLITSAGFIGYHVARTGDFDALLTLFTTSLLIFFILYLETEKTKYIYIFGLSILFAGITKGIAGFLFFPALFIIAVLYKKLISILKNKHFYISCISALTLILLLYFLRELQSPGYLKLVWKEELGGRFGTIIEGHQGPWNYYIDNLNIWQFNYWIIPFLLGVLIILFRTNEIVKSKSKIFYSFVIAITLYLFIISKADTKLAWYTAPIFPFISIIAALAITTALSNINLYFNNKVYLKYLFFILLSLIIFYAPLRKIILSNIEVYDDDFQIQASVMRKNNKFKNYKVPYYGYNGVIEFYSKILKSKGINTIVCNPKLLLVNDTVLVGQGKTLEIINANFKYNVIQEERNCNFIVITEIKEYLPVHYNDFENGSENYRSIDFKHSGSYSYLLKNDEYGYGIIISDKVNVKENNSLRINTKYYVSEIKPKIFLVASIEKDNKVFYRYSLGSEFSWAENNNWNSLELEFLIPPVPDDAIIKLYIYNPNKEIVYIDDFYVTIYLNH